MGASDFFISFEWDSSDDGSAAFYSPYCAAYTTLLACSHTTIFVATSSYFTGPCTTVWGLLVAQCYHSFDTHIPLGSYTD